MYKFAANVLKGLLSMSRRIKVYDKENLPKSGGYVIACTHTGWIDILWLGISVLPTELHFMAKKELFQNSFLRWLMKKLNAFPVNRENPGPSAIKIPRKLIKEGKVVGIFPSGTRTSDEVPLKRGAVTIASVAKAPLVPAAYIGPNNFSDLLKRKKPAIIFGKPIEVPKDQPKNMQVEWMMQELEKEMKNLHTRLIEIRRE